MKTTKETKEIKETNLKECATLWIHSSKNGVEYLSGNLSNDIGGIKVIGFFNPNKKNPKEPDVRVYSLNKDGEQETEILALWDNISKNETRYLLGKSNENENVIGFYNEKQEVKPYIKIYFRKD